MLKLTEKAQNKLQFFLHDRNLAEWGLRIKPQGSGGYHFALEKMDTATADDRILDCNGYKVILDKQSEQKLQEASIDFVDTAWSSGFKVEEKKSNNITPLPLKQDLSDPRAQKIMDLLNKEINPALAGHGGSAEFIAIRDNLVHLKLGGGCQGCASSQATLKHGIELRIKEEEPSIQGIVDMTDHAAGANPYFS